MKHHGPLLFSDNAKSTRVITNSGPTLPLTPAEGDLFTLTNVAGDTDHQYLGGEWIDITGSSATPYDLSVDAVNGATILEPLFIHTAIRPFKLTGLGIAKATVAGAGPSVFELVVDDGTPATVQIVTFAASSTTGTFSNTDVVHIKKGSIVKLVASSADENLVGLTFTFAGELIYPR